MRRRTPGRRPGRSPGPPPTRSRSTGNDHRPRSRPSPRCRRPGTPRRRCPAATTPSAYRVPTAHNCPWAASGSGLDQPMTDQHPVDAHPRRHRAGPGPLHLLRQPHRPPPRMLPAHLTHHRLDLRADLAGRLFRPPGPVHQGAQATLLIPADPGMHTLPRDPEPPGDLRDRNARFGLQHSPVTLLNNRQLGQCQPRPPATPPPATDEEQKSQLTAICKPCAGTVMSSISRDRTTAGSDPLPNPAVYKSSGAALQAAYARNIFDAWVSHHGDGGYARSPVPAVRFW